MKKLILFAVIFLIMGGLARAQVGASSFEFMLVGADSRAASMGEAFTAVSGDPGAPYFNPASAALMRSSEISLMHINYLTDVSMEHAALLTGSGKVKFGIGLHIGQVSNIQRRGDSPSQDPLGTFDEHNVTAAFTWALPLSERFYIGNSIKWAYEKLDLESASALAADLGAFYTLRPEVAFGASVRNLGAKPKFADESFDLPRELRLGVSYRTLPDSRWKGIILATDYILPKWGNGDSKFNLGGEYSYRNTLYLRLGYGAGYDSRGISAGAGLAYINYLFDYGYIPAKHNLSNTHRFTLRIRL